MAELRRDLTQIRERQVPGIVSLAHDEVVNGVLLDVVDLEGA